LPLKKEAISFNASSLDSNSMDVSAFVSDAPGRVVTIDGGEHAFVPVSLPPAWEFPAELWPRLVEAHTELGRLDGLAQTLSNPDLLLHPLEGREAIQSSRIEGTYATARELLLFELGEETGTSSEEQINAWKEVRNYRRALRHGIQSKLPLSLRLIRDMHRVLLSGVRGQAKEPGEFRRVQVAIGLDHRFMPPPPQELPSCLDRFEKYLHSSSSFNPLVDCFLAHYQFEAIHPFVDGNGRVGRLLLAIMIQQRCHLARPWLYMSDFFERNRDEYFRRLFDISARAAWTNWVEFCLQGAAEQARSALQRCQKLRSIRESYLAKLSDTRGSIRLHEIVEGLFHSPYIRVIDAQAKLKVTYPTAKADLERLVAAGILRVLPHTRTKTYYAKQVFDAAYRDLEG
jgi:Fic family protein